MKKQNLLVIPLLLSLIGMVGCNGDTSSSQSSSQSNSSNGNSSSGIVKMIGTAQKNSIKTSLDNKKEQSNKQEEFVNRKKPYYIGDDNNFNIRPSIIYWGGNSSKIETNFNISLEIKNGNEYTKVEDATQYLDNVDTTTCDLDFNEQAIGKTFRISVVPTDAPSEKINEFTQTLEALIVDGFNVYNAKELGYFNNNLTTTKDAWENFMTENNLNYKGEIKSLVLQDNISITKDDIPSYFMYSSDELKKLGYSENDKIYTKYLGSLKDQYEGIYHRNFQDKDETFSLYGNYFKLDAIKLPLVKKQSDKDFEAGDKSEVISHAALFKTRNINEDDKKYIFNISDLTVIGNASRQEDTSLGGGIIFHKSGHMVTNFNNMISRCWFITNFAEYKKAKYTINDSKEYDNFNSFIYNWGGNVEINNSEMTGAGGPIIIQDHVNPDKEDTHIGKSVINNSKLENWVAGTEGWFNLFTGASALALQVKGMDQLFNFFGGKTFLKNDDSAVKFNLICVNKSGGDAGLSIGQKISGSISFDNKTMDYGETDENFAKLYQNTPKGSQAIFRTTEDNSYAYTNGEGLFNKLDNNNDPVMVTKNDNIFKGDYLNVYSGGMFITLGYYDLTK